MLFHFLLRTLQSAFFHRKDTEDHKTFQTFLKECQHRSIRRLDSLMKSLQDLPKRSRNYQKQKPHGDQYKKKCRRKKKQRGHSAGQPYRHTGEAWKNGQNSPRHFSCI